MKTLAVTATILLALTTACTPGATAGPITPSVTPSGVTQSSPLPPTPTWDADQAAALTSARAYRAAMAKLTASGKFDQYAIIKALKPTATDPVIQSNLNALRKMRNKGIRDKGAVLELWSEAAPATKSPAVSVQVVFCVDQRGVTVVDAEGRVQPDSYPDFLKRTYDMRRSDTGAFRVYEASGQAVAGCSR